MPQSLVSEQVNDDELLVITTLTQPLVHKQLRGLVPKLDENGLMVGPLNIFDQVARAPKFGPLK